MAVNSSMIRGCCLGVVVVGGGGVCFVVWTAISHRPDTAVCRSPLPTSLFPAICSEHYDSERKDNTNKKHLIGHTIHPSFGKAKITLVPLELVIYFQKAGNKITR